MPCCSGDVGSVTLRALKASQKLLKMGNTRNTFYWGNYYSVKRWPRGKRPLLQSLTVSDATLDNPNNPLPFSVKADIQQILVETEEKQHHNGPLLNCTITKINT